MHFGSVLIDGVFFNRGNVGCVFVPFCMPKQKDPYLVAVGEQIRKKRREKNFAQEAFAAHAEIDRSYYGAIERGERNLSTLNLIRIAMRLEIEVGELFPERRLLEEIEK
jgi:DNA-binding XRE family transcriptional regulator